MKKILIIALCLMIDGLNAQTVKFKFYDNCTGRIVMLDYEISRIGKNPNSISVKDTTILQENGTYIIDVYRKYGDFYAHYSFTKDLLTSKIYNDTIELPRISIWFESSLDSKFSKFFKCEKVCNGYEIDYYKTGQKWIEGNFIDGIPQKKIKYYDRKGNLMKVEIYGKKGLRRIRYPNYNAFKENN